MSCNSVTSETLVKLVLNLVNTFSAVTFGTWLYRHQEKVKITGLKHHFSNLDEKSNISDQEKTEIKWWIKKLDYACHHFVVSNPNIKVSTDASLKGGCITDNIQLLTGLRPKSEIDDINVVELKTIEIDVWTYCFNKY